MEGSQPSSSKCHFFRLPTEIRTEIFRYLLVPSPECHVLRRHNRQEGRAPAILRVNRQIYTEAAPILYSESTVVIYPAELLRLCFELQPYHTYLASDPLYGNSSSSTLHWDSEGAMPPHVFARFEKVEMIIDPSFFHRAATSDIDIVIWIDKNFNKEADEIKNYAASLQQTNLFKDLATVLSKSSVLKALELTVFVAVDWVPPDEEDEDDVEIEEPIIGDSVPRDNDVDEEDDKQEGRWEKDLYMITVFNTATDILIRSGLLDPLKLLSNVEKFDVRALDYPYILENRTKDKVYRKLGPKTARTVQELKDAVEQNS